MNKTNNKIASILFILKKLWPIIVFAVPLFVTYDIYYRSTKNDLSIIEIDKSKIIPPQNIYVPKVLESDLKIKIKNIDVEGLYYFLYKMTNTGNKPIVPDDFVENISIKVPDPWLIYGIRYAGANEFSNENNLIWEQKDDGRYELQKTLINPQDSYYLIFYIISKKAENDTKNIQTLERKANFPTIEWRGRIIGVSKIFKSQFEANKMLLFQNIVVILHGTEIYLFLLLSLTIFLLHCILMYNANIFNYKYIYCFIFLLISMFFSMSTAEIIIFIIKKYNYLPLWVGCWTLIVLHFIFLFFISYLAIKESFKIKKEEISI